MANTYNTKNYFAHGGEQLVIGGKLTFLDGAEVENFPGSTSGTAASGTAPYAEPLLTVYGSGDITLMVGTTIVELEDISSSIVIDCALKEAYLGNALMNDHMAGDFPVLKPGANAVSWSGTVTRVVIQPNWRYL